MTENKRFTTRNGVFYTDNETGWEFECYGEVVKLMNELAEENIEFKIHEKFKNKAYSDLLNKFTQLKKKYQKSKKENKQLKDLIIHMGYTIKNENGIISLELKR